MMPLAFLVLLQTRQAPDTVGARDALRASITTVEHKVEEQDSWLHRAEHFVVNVPSFLTVMGMDSARANRWQSIISGLGARASAAEQSCPGGYDHYCPHMRALGLSRSGDHLDLLVGVGYLMARYGPTGKSRGRDVLIELHVHLTRVGNTYHIDSIAYGKRT